MRHADAEHEVAIACAKDQGVVAGGLTARVAAPLQGRRVDARVLRQ